MGAREWKELKIILAAGMAACFAWVPSLMLSEHVWSAPDEGDINWEPGTNIASITFDLEREESLLYREDRYKTLRVGFEKASAEQVACEMLTTYNHAGFAKFDFNSEVATKFRNEFSDDSYRQEIVVQDMRVDERRREPIPGFNVVEVRMKGKACTEETLVKYEQQIEAAVQERKAQLSL